MSCVEHVQTFAQIFLSGNRIKSMTVNLCLWFSSNELSTETGGDVCGSASPSIHQWARGVTPQSPRNTKYGHIASAKSIPVNQSRGRRGRGEDCRTERLM
ncbi:hypothetical protein BaRGS_00035073, partial [Batillaria attramentaria]